MKKFKFSLLGLCFFIVSALVIGNIHSFRQLLPSQEVEISHGAAFGPMVKDFLFVQEVTLKKRFINGVDVFLAKMPGTGSSQNVFLLLDASHRILFTKMIHSEEIDGACYYPVDFNKSIDIGKGGKIFACVNSIDGSMNNYLALPRKASSGLGKLYVIPVLNNDIISTLEKQQGVITFEGSMGIRTYESGSRFFTPLQMILYFFAFALALLIIFAKKIKHFILSSTLSPEYVFFGVSMVFGFAMVFITPPFQVPDEPQHLYRSYQISKFDVFKYRDSIPQSLVQLASICDRMKFMAHEKTSKKEIFGLAEIKLNPGLKSRVECPNYVLPYLPQSFGMIIGELFNMSPLKLFYLGRIFNLLVSVVLLFIAIRTTPVLKWLFFALSILPMTLYQMSSLSYDALTISLSFLIIATNFNLAFNEAKTIKARDILLLFVLSILLSSCKPPYYIAIFSFLIVPVSKLGSWKKMVIIGCGLVLTVLVISQSWAPSQQFFRSWHEKKQVISDSGPQPAPVPQGSEKAQTAQVPQNPAKTTAQPAAPGSADAKPSVQPAAPQAKPEQALVSPFDPPAQIKFILDDPFRFIGILIDTIGKFVGLYFISFIGLFGWVDTPLPPGIIYPYLILLIIIASSSPTKGININLLKKGILFSLFLIGFILVETAMYLYCNPVGCNPITAVQGRYFIAFGPLLFIIFYNHYFTEIAFGKPLLSKKQTEKEKRNQKKKTDVKGNINMELYTKSLPWIITGFGVFVLLYSLYTILARFYIVLI